ncbi:MAG: uracil-DNA glycosylase [Gemmatimonadota bacterium]
MNRERLIEYLRQRVELGDHELYLDTMTSAEFIRALNSPTPRLSVKSESDALTVLQQKAAACMACSLGATRTKSVFARGNPLSPLMVVGEAPGEEEDKTGLPFVGRAGKLLDVLLAAIGFPQDSAYICNVLKCRPPGNRNPLPNEVDACSGYLRGQIEVVKPRVLLAVGKFAAQTLLQSEESIGRLRGHIQQHNALPVVVTYHPAYLLRSPNATRVAWHDFQLVRTILDEPTRNKR